MQKHLLWTCLGFVSAALVGAHPVGRGSIGSARAACIDYDDYLHWEGGIYSLSQSEQGLQIIDTADPTSPIAHGMTTPVISEPDVEDSGRT